MELLGTQHFTFGRGCTYWHSTGKGSEWERKISDSQTDEGGLWKNEQQNAAKHISEENKREPGCQALAQQMYFPLCAQLDLWDCEQYSPLFSQTLTQAGEFSFSVLGCCKNSTRQLHGGSLTSTRKCLCPYRLDELYHQHWTESALEQGHFGREN